MSQILAQLFKHDFPLHGNRRKKKWNMVKGKRKELLELKHSGKKGDDYD
jgi:hypothetical protein